VHQNLRVVGNQIHMHAGSTAVVLNIKSIAGVVLEGNVVHSLNRTMTPDQLVSAENCSGVVVQNNTVITT
jgi:hypothetical protein